MSDAVRLKKFVQDQEEAVQLARSTPEASNQIRVDAINAALSLAHCNAEYGRTVSVESLLKDAEAIEEYLSKS